MEKGGPVDGEAVKEFLNSNEEFLDNYIVENVDVDVLERWLIRKLRIVRKLSGERKSICRWKFCVHADKGRMLQEITASIMNHPTQEQVLWELGRCISSAVGVDGFTLFRIRPNHPDRVDILKKNKNEVQSEKLPENSYNFIIELSERNEPVRINDGPILYNNQINYCNAKHVMFQPIPQSDGRNVGVLQMWRNDHKFYEEDEEISSSYLVWGGIALHYARLYHDMQTQRRLGDFLLTVVKSIFQDMVSIETLVHKVMNFAQKLVDADRASLFLVDSKTRELHATVFDIGNENEKEKETEADGTEKKRREIRFPLGTGIAGHVAETGEVLNIRDAYKDPRFNRTVDRLTGYKTKTILCMPIYIRNNVIGVVQMVNKRVGYFTESDEKAFEMFAVYCGLALHHAKLYNRISRSEQKYKVALEVLSYHNTCTNEEVEMALVEALRPKPVELDNFYCSPFLIDDFQKATAAIYMFIDLFGLTTFDQTELVKFVLTVRKNYRRVPYHNWTHGFSVANSIYSILKRVEVFTANEKLALFIGCLCHDLDHRGKSNKYMSDIESPLAAVYSTSTMEHHHFNQTVTILQQEGHNIFRQLAPADYREVLGMLKHCILATDLALFFPNKAKLEQLVNTNQFHWSLPDHRELILAVSMTAADLSASAKPWDIQVETVKVIFQEFYLQGDEERAAGREPQAMMDRDRPEQQAASQVGFLVGICVPCYSLLSRVMPETEPLLTMCQENLERWRNIHEEVTRVMEENKDEEGAIACLPSHLYLPVDSP